MPSAQPGLTGGELRDALQHARIERLDDGPNKRTAPKDHSARRAGASRERRTHRPLPAARHSLTLGLGDPELRWWQTAEPSRPGDVVGVAMDSAQVIEEHERSGRYFAIGGRVESFVLDQGNGEPVVCLHGVPARRSCTAK